MATAKKKTNKSAWIRSQPPEMPAADVVAKAKKEGIKLTSGQVYTARSTGKGSAPKGKPGPKPKAAAAVSSGRGAGNGSLEETIRAIVRSEIKRFFAER
jgi:hypothetical protein